MRWRLDATPEAVIFDSGLEVGPAHGQVQSLGCNQLDRGHTSSAVNTVSSS
jgi:hypothetical protein